MTAEVREPGAGGREPMRESNRAHQLPATGSRLPAPARRCPRCGAWLGARASAALVAQRQAQAEGQPVAVGEDAPFCGCCGLLIATAVAAEA